MDTDKFLQRCKALAGDQSGAAWTDDNMFGFFQAFRPDGLRLEPLFSDIPNGIAVYQRLLQVFSATSIGWCRGDLQDLYFIVRAPELAAPEVLLGCAIELLTNWRSMAISMNDQEVVDKLTPLPNVKVNANVAPSQDPNDIESLDLWIYEMQGDWHGDLICSCPYARSMREAFYSLGCDYYLAHYVTWPWYHDSSSLADPYSPYFALWRHGATLQCNSPDDVTLYLGVA